MQVFQVASNLYFKSMELQADVLSTLAKWCHFHWNFSCYMIIDMWCHRFRSMADSVCHFSMILHIEIISVETSDFLEQTTYLKAFNSVFSLKQFSSNMGLNNLYFDQITETDLGLQFHSLWPTNWYELLKMLTDKILWLEDIAFPLYWF